MLLGVSSFPSLGCCYHAPRSRASRIVTSGQQHGVRIHVVQSASALWPGLLAGWKACIRPISCKVLANGVRAASATARNIANHWICFLSAFLAVAIAGDWVHTCKGARSA